MAGKWLRGPNRALAGSNCESQSGEMNLHPGTAGGGDSAGIEGADFSRAGTVRFDLDAAFGQRPVAVSELNERDDPDYLKVLPNTVALDVFVPTKVPSRTGKISPARTRAQVYRLNPGQICCFVNEFQHSTRHENSQDI